MKISKKSILVIWWTIILTWLGSIFIPTIASDSEDTPVELYVKPDNAVQHFRNVKIIASGDTDNSNAIIHKNWNSVWIYTNNFILSKVPEIWMTRCDVNKDWIFNENDNISDIDTNADWTYDDNDRIFCTHINQIIKWAKWSSILWWIANSIEAWNAGTILWWNANEIQYSESSSILWWIMNTLTGTSFSIIFWWQQNNITWGRASSLIWWSDNNIATSYSTAIWNNNTISWYNSIAMWFKSNVTGRNSFLWTDGSSTKTLWANNTFAIIWSNGMIINSKKAYNFAKLTISNSLIIYNDGNDPTCTEETKWVLKVITGDNYNSQQICFCNCDGYWRNALHEWTRCQALCSNDTWLHAECGTAQRNCDTTPYTYSWNCTEWTLVEWTWAFLVSTEKKSDWTLINYINRSCQAVDWQIQPCKQKLEWDWCENHLWGGHCIWDINDATPIAGSNQAPSEDTQKRAYRRNEYSNQDCAYFCNTWFVAFEWKCYKCEDWTRNENDPDVCSFNVECKEWRHWNWNNCVLDAYCKNAQTNSIVKETDIETNYLKNTITTLETIIPKETSDDYYLKCIDDGNYKNEYIENTCSYKCKPWYYCNNGTCTLPSCRSKESLSDSYGDKNYYYVTWHAWYSNFNSAPTFIKDWEDQTSERFYNKYANKNWCYYWCPKENRLYYKNMRRCYSPEKKAEIQNNMEPYCGQIYLYWYGASYKNPESPNQGWTYVSPKTLAEKKANNAKWCFLSCEEWSIYAYQQAIRIYTYTNWWKAGEKLIFNSTARSCFKKCDSDKWEILNKNGRCEVCPDGQIPNPESYQIWKFGRVGNDGKTPPYLQEYDKKVTAPEWIYNEFGQYRNCIIGCDPGYVLKDNICEKISEDGECAWWIDKDGKCKVCLYKWQMYSETKGACIDKKAILEFSVINTDPQWNKKTYTNWDKINYKVTIKNSWNLTIKNIKSLSYALSGNEKRIPNIWSKSIWELSPWNSTWYTLSYTLTWIDFNKLSTWQTWDFSIIVTATWTAIDNFIKDITVESSLLKVIIKKT